MEPSEASKASKAVAAPARRRLYELLLQSPQGRARIRRAEARSWLIPRILREYQLARPNPPKKDKKLPALDDPPQDATSSLRPEELGELGRATTNYNSTLQMQPADANEQAADKERARALLLPIYEKGLRKRDISEALTRLPLDQRRALLEELLQAEPPPTFEEQARGRVLQKIYEESPNLEKEDVKIWQETQALIKKLKLRTNPSEAEAPRDSHERDKIMEQHPDEPKNRTKYMPQSAMQQIWKKFRNYGKTKTDISKKLQLWSPNERAHLLREFLRAQPLDPEETKARTSVERELQEKSPDYKHLQSTLWQGTDNLLERLKSQERHSKLQETNHIENWTRRAQEWRRQKNFKSYRDSALVTAGLVGAPLLLAAHLYKRRSNRSQR